MNSQILRIEIGQAAFSRFAQLVGRAPRPGIWCQAALADIDDRNGDLWRVSEGHMIDFHEVPLPWQKLEVFYDLQQEP